MAGTQFIHDEKKQDNKIITCNIQSTFFLVGVVLGILKRQQCPLDCWLSSFVPLFVLPSAFQSRAFVRRERNP
jgi:hypothetical protein